MQSAMSWSGTWGIDKEGSSDTIIPKKPEFYAKWTSSDGGNTDPLTSFYFIM